MLESKVRTPQETAEYLESLRQWLAEMRETPAEEMTVFFAKRIDVYESVHLKNWPEEYAHIADYLEEGLTSLLDIGCGTGLELESVFRRFPEVAVTGIDLSPLMLEKLQEKYRNKDIRLLCADYFACPLGENRFDAALSFETLHHFKADRKLEIYEKLYRAVKPGGIYLECDYTACCDEEEAMCLEGYEYRMRSSGIPESAFVHIDIPLTLAHQISLMKRAGFDSVEVLYQNCGTVICKARKR